MKQLEHSALCIDVGFLLHQDVGYNRKYEINEKNVQIAEDLDACDLTGEIQFTRTTAGLYARGKLKVQTPLECVRCLSEFDQKLSAELSELFAFSPDKETDPLLTIPQTGILDMTELVREYLILDIPIQPVCGTECAGLCEICGNPKQDGICEHPEEEIDPRMAVLKSLLTNS